MSKSSTPVPFVDEHVSNGTSGHTNEEPILPSGFRRADVVRLLVQCMGGLGYGRAAAALEEDAGVPLLSEAVGDFRAGVLAGEWEKAERLIPELGLAPASRDSVRFLIHRQHFLECIEAQQPAAALRCLRESIAPLAQAAEAAEAAAAAAASAAAASAAAAAASGDEADDGDDVIDGVSHDAIDRGAGTPRPPPQLGSPSGPAPAPAAPLVAAAPRLGTSVQELSAHLLCKSVGELKARTGWDGAGGGSRRALLAQLQAHVPPSLLLPEDRLLTLLHQAMLWQTHPAAAASAGHQRRCPPALLAGVSLFEDFSASRDEVPRSTRHVLEGHTDEVWFVQFSPSGALLASASKDNVVVVWDVTQPSVPKLSELRGHEASLAFVAWAPSDDDSLLTCANDHLIKLWRVRTAECLRTYARHGGAVTACAWLPDGRHFVSAGVDKNLFLWDAGSGAVLQSWHGPRCHDLAVSSDASRPSLVAISSERKLHVVPIHFGGVGPQPTDGVVPPPPPPKLDTEAEVVLAEAEAITSLALSSDGRHVLVNVAAPEGASEIHVWDLHAHQQVQRCAPARRIERRGEEVLVGVPRSSPVRLASAARRYRGQRQTKFVIRSAFGGANEAFVVSGSEDSQVYVWHRHNARLLEVLPGHSGTVNAVAWNPRDPHMFASASDDHTVRIWGVSK